MEMWFKVMEKSWKSIGQHVYEPWVMEHLEKSWNLEMV